MDVTHAGWARHPRYAAFEWSLLPCVGLMPLKPSCALAPKIERRSAFRGKVTRVRSITTCAARSVKKTSSSGDCRAATAWCDTELQEPVGGR